MDSRDMKDQEEGMMNQKPIATQLAEFSKGVQKLSEVQAMVNEARTNR